MSLARYEALGKRAGEGPSRGHRRRGRSFSSLRPCRARAELQRTILEARWRPGFARKTSSWTSRARRSRSSSRQNRHRQTGPVSPDFLLNIVLSVVIGLTAGVGLAYFIEYLDTSVKTVDDVERYLGVPVIGVIPQKVRPLIEEGRTVPMPRRTGCSAPT